MKEFNLEDSKYITLEDNIWILPSSVAVLKGKDKNNYNNWTFTGYANLLPGEEIRLTKGSPIWTEVLATFKNKYNHNIAVSEDVKLISIERARAYLTVDRPRHVVHSSLSRNNSSLTLPKYEEPTITSLDFAKHLEIDHNTILRSVTKYKSDLEYFGSISFDFLIPDHDTGEHVKSHTVRYCDLNEDQCYFLATLSRNSDKVVQFKKWLVNTFSMLKEDKKIQGSMGELLSLLPGNWEGLVQAMLCHLSTFTDKPFRQEVFLHGKNRIDVLMSDSEALEIKNHIINPCHIKEITLNKGYWFQLKEQLPNFKTLYVTSTFGISEPALGMIKLLEPELQYVPLLSLFQKVAPNRELPLHLFPKP